MTNEQIADEIVKIAANCAKERDHYKSLLLEIREELLGRISGFEEDEGMDRWLSYLARKTEE